MSTLTCVRTKHNPNQTYEEFKELRLLGFGASDIGSLLNEGDYSCKRRLFLERLGLFHDEESRLQHHVERGKFLEGPVAGLFKQQIYPMPEVEVRLCGTAYIKEHPFMRANADRLIVLPADQTDRYGVLEIKCPGEHMFRKIKKDGLPLAYILQLQWQMFCYGTAWGTFAVYWADGHELITFDVQRDDALIESMAEAVKREWGWLQVFQGFLTGEDPLRTAEEFFKDSAFPCALDPHSKACANCPMYEKCHSISYQPKSLRRIDALAEKAKEFAILKENTKDYEKRLEALKFEFRQAFLEHKCDSIHAGPYQIRISERSRESLSPKVKEVLTAEQAVTYIKHTTFDVIDVKEAK